MVFRPWHFLSRPSIDQILFFFFSHVVVELALFGQRRRGSSFGGNDGSFRRKVKTLGISLSINKRFIKFSFLSL